MSDNKKQINKFRHWSERMKTPERDSPITARQWREACASGRLAKELLVGMSIGGKNKIIGARDVNGVEIPIQEVSETQALGVIRELCPDWAKKGFRH